jgi:dTDP-4-dehydrorhamnose 3,5-epimerase
MESLEFQQPQIFSDDRGFFREVVNVTQEPFKSSGIKFIQQNVSYNAKHVFRGLHYQHKFPQGKLVTVFRGEVVDYVIDLRKKSTEFGKVRSFSLSEDNQASLWVPQGFAHGFLSLQHHTIFSYCVFGHSRVADDEISITPFSFADLMKDLPHDVVMTEKDRMGVFIKDAPYYT